MLNEAQILKGVLDQGFLTVENETNIVTTDEGMFCITGFTVDVVFATLEIMRQT